MSSRLNLLWLAALLVLIALIAWMQREPATPRLEDVAWKSLELRNAIPPQELVSRIDDQAAIRAFVMQLVKQKPILVQEAPKESPEPGPAPDYVIEMEASNEAKPQTLCLWLSYGTHRIQWWSHPGQSFRVELSEQVQAQIFKQLKVRWDGKGEVLMPISP